MLEVALPSVLIKHTSNILKYSHVHHVGTYLLPSNKQHYGHIAALFSEVVKFDRRDLNCWLEEDSYL